MHADKVEFTVYLLVNSFDIGKRIKKHCQFYCTCMHFMLNFAFAEMLTLTLGILTRYVFLHFNENNRCFVMFGMNSRSCGKFEIALTGLGRSWGAGSGLGGKCNSCSRRSAAASPVPTTGLNINKYNHKTVLFRLKYKQNWKRRFY